MGTLVWVERGQTLLSSKMEVVQNHLEQFSVQFVLTTKKKTEVAQSPPPPKKIMYNKNAFQ